MIKFSVSLSIIIKYVSSRDVYSLFVLLVGPVGPVSRFGREKLYNDKVQHALYEIIGIQYKRQQEDYKLKFENLGRVSQTDS